MPVFLCISLVLLWVTTVTRCRKEVTTVMLHNLLSHPVFGARLPWKNVDTFHLLSFSFVEFRKWITREK